MQSQSLISGSDLLEEMLDDVFAERLEHYIDFTKEEELFVNDRDMILNIVKKMISSRERINILKELAADCLLHYIHSQHCAIYRESANMAILIMNMTCLLCLPIAALI